MEAMLMKIVILFKEKWSHIDKFYFWYLFMNGNHILKWKVYRTFFLLGPKDYRNYNEHTASQDSALRAAQLAAQRSAQLAAQRAVRSPATRRALQQTPAEKAWKRHARPTNTSIHIVTNRKFFRLKEKGKEKTKAIEKTFADPVSCAPRLRP